MNALARREHSRQQLANKLTARGFSQHVPVLLTELEERGWLCEARFVEACVRSTLTKGRGPLALKAQLQRAGVSYESASHWVRETDWVRAARAQLHKRYAGGDAMETPQARARGMRYLLSRGYTTEQAREALAQWEVDDDDEQC